MVRVLGVDPGTRSFDLALVEDGRVEWEASVDTALVARSPEALLEAIREAGSVDAVAAPSGYGVPVTPSGDVVDARRLAVEVLLLSTWGEIEEGVRRGVVGAMVYAALARVVEALASGGGPRSIFIPAVIHLPTLRPGAKYNRVDLGTADKLSVALLASYLEGGRGRFMVLELGFGYNALMVVEDGRVTWALGGTSLGPGFITAGPLDLEVVAMGGGWGRLDVFHGGVMEACGASTPEEALERARSSSRGLCAEAYNAMLDSIATAVAAVHTRFGVSRLLVSGRYSASPALLGDLRERLPGGVEVERLGLLEGASRSKHAAQGYALVVEGLLGGRASRAVERMAIPQACGTALDYVAHPRLAQARERVRRAYLESVRSPRLCS
ncbi:MAG: DUF1464 family protein [Desulfurococcales archaeon]|nr:DUF1464 family protein [Desulfurococcales archaeon]